MLPLAGENMTVRGVDARGPFRWMRCEGVPRTSRGMTSWKELATDSAAMAERVLAKAATRAVRGSKPGRPVMVLLDLLGRRWTLRILWELRGAPLTSRALREACDDASPTVLQARLTDLRDAGLVRHEKASGYA